MKTTIIRNIEVIVKEMQNPKPQYMEAKIPPMSFAKIGGTPEMIKCEQIVYNAVQLFNPETEQKEIFYVKYDDTKVFNGLIEITNHWIQKIKREATLKEFERMQENIFIEIEIAEEETIRNIKSLSWWKRLFNKF